MGRDGADVLNGGPGPDRLLGGDGDQTRDGNATDEHDHDTDDHAFADHLHPADPGGARFIGGGFFNIRGPLDIITDPTAQRGPLPT